VAVGAWFVVSRYAKSSDFDRLKNRLVGAPKKKNQKKTAGVGGQQQVIHQEDTTKNQFAQQLVNKYQWGPKLAEFLEQAGLRMSAARFVHLTIVLFMGGVAFGWLMLPSPNRWRFCWELPRQRALHVRPHEAQSPAEEVRGNLPGHARVRLALDARGARIFGVARNDPSRISGARFERVPRTFEEHNLGLPIEVALQKLAKRIPSLDVHFFVSAVLLQKRTGGNLAEILDKLAYVIRERFKLRGRIRAVSAHGKMTATALSCIPIAVAVLMFYTNPDYVKFFFLDEVGNYMLAAAVGLQIIGYLVMQKIVKIEV
jgi:tight adherence protein B